MGHYGQHAIQPAAQNPMFISSEVHVNHTDVHTKDRSGCASCMDRLISGLYYRAKHQAHFAIAKALFTPIVAMICIILGQLLQRKASLSKEEYQASMLNSLLAAFVGGHCLVGSVIILNIMLDTQPSPGRLWHRYFTFTSMLILFATGAAAGPLGVKIMEDSNMIVLDPRHAFYSSGLGAGLIFWILVIVKALLLSHRKLDTLDSYNSTTTICTQIDWSCKERDCNCCRDCDCNCCRGCANCNFIDCRCCDCNCCHGCGGCGGCGGCDCNCNC